MTGNWPTNCNSWSPIEFPLLVWTPNISYRIQRNSPLDPFLSQMNPVQNLKPYFSKIHFNVTFPFTPTLPIVPLYCISDYDFIRISHVPIHVPSCHHPHNICWRVQIMKLLIIQFCPISCYSLPLRSKYSPQLPVLKHSQSVFFWFQCHNNM